MRITMANFSSFSLKNSLAAVCAQNLWMKWFNRRTVRGGILLVLVIDFVSSVLFLIWNVDSKPSYFNSQPVFPELLPTGFDEESCVSRYQFQSYHDKHTLGKASPYLISKLRSYEARHKKCGPYTDMYNNTLNLLTKSSNASDESSHECKYIVWISYNGVGNKIMTITSAFLYALLTDRVLLIDRGNDISDLFCEPFPGTSWFLPLDFPFSEQFNGFGIHSKDSFGNLLKKQQFQRPYLYLHLVYDYNDDDKLFFCDQYHPYLQNISWLMMKSDNYFIPFLFLNPYFEELSNLFPDKELVLHHLGRYLFHPTNAVWGLVNRYYEAYLSMADTRIGIQIRVSHQSGMLNHVLDQILSCTMNEGILPRIDQSQEQMKPSRNNTTIVVMIISLDRGYFEKVRDLYWENPTITGEYITVHQPSFEEYQQTETLKHDMKALAEIYLLSLTDKLVTSAWSTFGYVAQGLGGLKPWILYKPENEIAPDPPCQKVTSMEPCFHSPPLHDCKNRDPANLVPYVRRQCEDVTQGVKLVQTPNHV